MTDRNILGWFIWYLILLSGIQFTFAQTEWNEQVREECTIGVASGRATSDGRPLLWKTRDNSSAPNNEVYYNTSSRYKFISVITAGGTSAWMGVNEKGFAILNSLSSDLPGGSSGLDNGSLMRYALGICVTVADFEHLLDNTNVTGRYTRANFGVIDTTGEAAIFETSGNQYWKFDANNNIQAPNGYLLRTNFAINGGGNSGIERYKRTSSLIADFYAGDSLNYQSIIRFQMRDFSDSNSNPVSVPFPYQWQSDRPFGYIYCYLSICRSTSVSAAVIQGVLQAESAKLSTMWTILGQPASAIAVPYWPVGNTPSEADGNSTAPLCDIAKQIKSHLFDYDENSHYIDSYKLRDGNGNGLWARIFPVEDSILTATEHMLNQWRTNTPAVKDMLTVESELARYALSSLQKAYDELVTVVAGDIPEITPSLFMLDQNYPNPFNLSTTIQFLLTRSCFVTLQVFNISGEEVTTLISQEITAGKYVLNWDALDLASGIYFYRLHARSIDSEQSVDFFETKKLTLIK
ncbi:MAG: T9SS type A sorting domain-containing protein [bacterium]|nr:MAG: T9SS type A sorting domain-containing protein [bacterium]